MECTQVTSEGCIHTCSPCRLHRLRLAVLMTEVQNWQPGGKLILLAAAITTERMWLPEAERQIMHDHQLPKR
jgi:hypothetical protein